MEDIIECVLFKPLSQKPKSISIYKDICDISNDNVQIKCKDYHFNKNIINKYGVNLTILYSLDYEDNMYHFIGIKMCDIEKTGSIPKDNEINKKEFWWVNIYDKNYSLNCGEVLIVRYNSNGNLDNISTEDYKVLENIIIAPEDLCSDDEDSRGTEDLESIDEDYNPEDDSESSSEEYNSDEENEDSEDEIELEFEL